MVISDLNILCFNEGRKNPYKDDSIGCDVFKKVSQVYGIHWESLHHFQERVYQLYPKTSTGEYDYQRGFFQLKIRDNAYYVCLDALTPTKLREILCYYLDKSPVNKICVLIRLDWENENVIQGPYSLDVFMRKLQEERIQFNIAYIIEK